MPPRNAQLYAVALAVLCPYCGAEQVNQNGSEMWEPHEVAMAVGRRRCVSCDETITIHDGKTAKIYN